MRLLVAAAAMACGMASAAPLDLKGIRLGAPQGEIAGRFEGLRCSGEPAITECVYHRKGMGANVTELNTLADELVEMWAFTFVDGKLGEVVVIIPHGSFSKVRAAMHQKFGPPKSEKKEFTNALGGRFTGVEDTWDARPEWLTAHEYYGNRDLSAISLVSSTYTARIQAHKAAQAKKRAKDL